MDKTNQDTAQVEQPAKNRKPALIISIIVICLCFAAHYVWTYYGKEVYLTSYMEDAYLNYFLETFIVQCGNFGIVATILWWFGGPMLEKMVADRKKRIEHDIDESGRVKAEAEKVYAEVSEKMAVLEEEKQEMAEQFAKLTEEECARIKEDAKKTAMRIEEDARSSFELQASVAQRAFENEVLNQALESAREEIVHRVQNDPSLRDRLIEQGIASL